MTDKMRVPILEIRELDSATIGIYERRADWLYNKGLKAKQKEDKKLFIAKVEKILDEDPRDTETQYSLRETLISAMKEVTTNNRYSDTKRWKNFLQRKYFAFIKEDKIDMYRSINFDLFLPIEWSDEEYIERLWPVKNGSGNFNQDYFFFVKNPLYEKIEEKGYKE